MGTCMQEGGGIKRSTDLVLRRPRSRTKTLEEGGGREQQKGDEESPNALHGRHSEGA